MIKGNWKIELSEHARLRLKSRGTTESETIETIEKSSWQPMASGRMECRKDYVYNKEWNGKKYKTRQIRPIFIQEGNRVVVITVYVYYF